MDFEETPIEVLRKIQTIPMWVKTMQNREKDEEFLIPYKGCIILILKQEKKKRNKN